MKTAVLLRVAAVLDAIARPVILAGLWVGRLTAWLVLAIIAVVLLTVVMNALGMNELARWQDRVFLLGRALTINSVIDMQWHLYGVLILFGATYALHTNSHVRVDFIFERFSPRTRLIIDTVGHLALLIPFCWIVAEMNWPQVRMSFISGEQSNYGGLTHRFLIKGALPTALGWLALNAAARCLSNLAAIIDPARLEKEKYYVR